MPPKKLEDEKIDMRLEVPVEVLDLLRFMCETWQQIDDFVYTNCIDQIIKYPVIQGASNQFKLLQIGRQPYKIENLKIAAEWMQQFNQ